MKLEVEIPEELKELRLASSISWQLAVEKRLKEEFNELARLERIAVKSKLSEKKAEELADEVSLALAKKYETFAKGK